MEEIIKSYKGFNTDMTCYGGFQYEEGKEYETDSDSCCNYGFHACEYPLDCFSYFSPNQSVFHEVEQSGEISKKNNDSKLASTKIKIGAEISIAGLVKAAIEYTTERAKDSGEKHNTGYRGASSNTGDWGASSNTGYCGASSNTGNGGASSNTGYRGASSNTGDWGESSNTGNCGASSNTGYRGSTIADHENSVAVAWGHESRAKGVIGATLVFAEWENNDGYYLGEKSWTFKGSMMVRVDGEKIKDNTWYTMKNGQVIEAKEEDYIPD